MQVPQAPTESPTKRSARRAASRGSPQDGDAVSHRWRGDRYGNHKAGGHLQVPVTNRPKTAGNGVAPLIRHRHRSSELKPDRRRPTILEFGSSNECGGRAVPGVDAPTCTRDADIDPNRITRSRSLEQGLFQGAPFEPRTAVPRPQMDARATVQARLVIYEIHRLPGRFPGLSIVAVRFRGRRDPIDRRSRRNDSKPTKNFQAHDTPGARPRLETERSAFRTRVEREPGPIPFQRPHADGSRPLDGRHRQFRPAFIPDGIRRRS